MSTNYYFQMYEDLQIGHRLDEFALIDGSSNLLHIGKRSRGWEPLFQRTKYYSSLMELKDFYEKHKDVMTIIDEYRNELSFDELNSELIHWSKTNPEAKKHTYEKKPNVFDNSEIIYKDDEGYAFANFEFF